MTQSIQFHAVPDNRAAHLICPAPNRPKRAWPNVLVFNDKVRKCLDGGFTFLRAEPGAFPPLDDVERLINMCADADGYHLSLMALCEALEGREVLVFNHPAEVLRTRRDLIAGLLSGVPNLRVPKCVRFRCTSVDSIRACFDDHGFDYPVLVRAAGSQTGRDLFRVDGSADWETIRLFGRDMYMTEFVDCAGSDGRNRKLRISIVGSGWQLRHVQIADTWQVHRGDRSDESLAEELELIKALETSSDFRGMVEAVMARIRLDYWGLDLGYRGSSQEFVFFEGNPAMSMLFNQRSIAQGDAGMAELRRRKQDVSRRLEAMLLDHLVHAERWIGSGIRSAEAVP